MKVRSAGRRGAAANHNEWGRRIIPPPAAKGRGGILCRVYARPGAPQRGVLLCGPLRLNCALGRGGIARLKREGDGATPASRYSLEGLIVRRDRLPGPATPVPARTMRPSDAWEEAPRSGNYNRLVHRHAAAAGDRLWRDDRLYDVVGVLGWNRRERASYRGSAIFLHLCRPDMGPTAGCIALAPRDLKLLLERCGRRPVFAVADAPRKLQRLTPLRPR
ncbi:MAG TPA: L,D-transpeptidase family protein [Afifellaceae bacterium]|nr:L,D-transpeptidase family protein [Afifellaceae bacterium]